VTFIFSFDEDLDCLDGHPKIKQKSVNIVKDIMLANELIDVREFITQTKSVSQGENQILQFNVDWTFG